ncbi:MAG: FAD-dependent oxidoreductase [Candidatus Bathyarchaeota archaeon]
MSRRDFLKTAAAGAAAAGVAGMAGKGLLGQMFPPGVQAAKKPPPPPPIDINSAVIVGAGIAGLTAAYMLSQIGKTVTVLEACHRPGGRVQTKYYPDGTYACVAYSETYGHGFDPELDWLLGELGLGNQTVQIPDISFYNWRDEYHYQTGGWTSFLNELPWDDEEGGAAFYESEDFFWYAEKDFDWPLDEYSYPSYDYTDWEDYMLWTEHKKKGKVPNWRSDVAELWDISFRQECGVNAYLYSAGWGVLCGIYWDLPTFEQIKGGNYRIIEELVTRLPAGSLKLNEPATSVTETATGVQVESTQGTYTADVAIVATQFGKVNDLVPGLPSARAAINDSLEPAEGNKNFICLQQYSERFWQTIHGVKGWGGYSDHGVSRNYPTTKPGSYLVSNETVNEAGTIGILATYINEPEATPIYNQYASSITPGSCHVREPGRSAITEIAIADIETYWPEVRNYVIPGSERVYLWDPYGPAYPVGHVANGNYATLKTGISDPYAGPIFFCGDYVEDFGAGDAVLSVQNVVARFGAYP